MNQTPPPPAKGSPKKGNSCLLYGCLTFAVLAILLCGGIVLGVRHIAKRLVDTYTDTSPMTLPKVDMPQEEFDRLKNRISLFNQALEKKTNTPPLVLTSREINALFANSPEAKQMEIADHFYITLDGDKVTGQVSLPLDKFQTPTISTKGRYLNGVGTFKIALTNSTLEIYMQSLQVKGKPMPENFMSAFRGENLAKEINNDQQKTSVMSKIESLEIKDSTVIIKPKQN